MLVKFSDGNLELVIREVIHLELDCDVTLYFHQEDFNIACEVLQPTDHHKFSYNNSILVLGEYWDCWEGSVFKGYSIGDKLYKFIDVFN